MMNKWSILIIQIILMLWNNETEASDYKLWYRQPAKNWYEAIPIGNGKMGVMVHGGVRCDRFQLSEESMWSGRPKAKTLSPHFKETRDSIRHLLETDDLENAENLMKELDYSKYDGLDGIIINKVTCEEHRFETLGNLWLFCDLPNYPESNYYRDLDLNSACAKVSFTINGVNYYRESFCSFPSGVTVIRLWSDQKSKISFQAILNRPTDMNETWSDLKNRNYSGLFFKLLQSMV